MQRLEAIRRIHTKVHIVPSNRRMKKTSDPNGEDQNHITEQPPPDPLVRVLIDTRAAS